MATFNWPAAGALSGTMVGTATAPAVIFLHRLNNLVMVLLNVSMRSEFTGDENFTVYYKCIITIKTITVTFEVFD